MANMNDNSRYFDPKRHPLRNITSGKLFTIDRGYRFKTNRYWTATDGMGSDSLAGKIASLYSNGSGYSAFERGYKIGDELQKTLKPNETASVNLAGKTIAVTRVR